MFKLVKNSRILHISNLIKNVNVFNCQIDLSQRNLNHGLSFSTTKPDNQSNEIKIKFLLQETNKIVEATANENDTLLDVIVNNDIEIDGFGACGGTAACSTCHLIFKRGDFKIVGEPFGDETDMLDLAPNCCETSRLGCQVSVTKEMDGFMITIPSSRNDARID